MSVRKKTVTPKAVKSSPTAKLARRKSAGAERPTQAMFDELMREMDRKLDALHKSADQLLERQKKAMSG